MARLQLTDVGFVQTFNRVAESYESKYASGCSATHEIILQECLDAGVVPASILDIGCATGALLSRLKTLWPNAEIHGIDPAEKMVSVGSRDPRLRGCLEVGRAERLRFADDSIDLVVSTTSFGHWSDQLLGLYEIHRVLNAGGLAVIVEHRPPRVPVAFALSIAQRLPNYQSVPSMEQLLSYLPDSPYSVRAESQFVVSVLRKNTHTLRRRALLDDRV